MKLTMLTAALACATSTLSAQAAKAPNIVFFLADDLGQRDLACYGSTFYETPNLDKMAAEGAKFSQAYAACPVCSPTRASILTGKWPVGTGVTDYIGAAQPTAWKRNTKLLPAAYDVQLALNETTIAEALKKAGYTTMHAGKWHLGAQGFWPEDQGFDVNKGGIDKGGPYGGKKYFSPYDNPRLPDGPPGEHLPDRLADECNRFIETNKDKPFFVSYWFYDVHTPLMARDDLLKKYRDKKERLGLAAQFGTEGERAVRQVQEHAVYAGMVEAMDAAVGKVLKKLDDLGLRENTIVIFTSDNGGLSTSEGSPTSNLPWRGGKGWLYEGGIREPLLVRWPSTIKANSQIETPVSSPDFFPTLLEIAGTKPPADYPGDGLSLVPLFKGAAPKTFAERPLFWHYPHYGNQGGAPGAAMRSGQWKLIEWGEGEIELFDLGNDPGEQNNLAKAQPQRVKTMRDALHAWQIQTGARFATPNPNYDPAKRSGRAAG